MIFWNISSRSDRNRSGRKIHVNLPCLAPILAKSLMVITRVREFTVRTSIGDLVQSRTMVSAALLISGRKTTVINRNLYTLYWPEKDPVEFIDNSNCAAQHGARSIGCPTTAARRSAALANQPKRELHACSCSAISASCTRASASRRRIFRAHLRTQLHHRSSSSSVGGQKCLWRKGTIGINFQGIFKIFLNGFRWNKIHVCLFEQIT